MENFQSRKIYFLEMELSHLIERHTLPEVLNWLAALVHSQSTFAQNAAYADLYNQIESNLEKAATASLDLINAKSQKGQKLWD